MTIKSTLLNHRDFEGKAPYTHLNAAVLREVGEWHFIVLLYGAYNAMGLIGTEYNGIAILDDGKKKCVVLDQHMQGGMGVSDRQCTEFKRVVNLSDEDLLTFINTHPRKRQAYLTTAELRQVVKAQWKPKIAVMPEPPTFTRTEFSSAADKQRFAKYFMRFVAKDFPPGLFQKWFYTQLSMCFQHIAHFNAGGFYSTWFDTPEKRLAFLVHTVDAGLYGDPAYTYVDVERFLQNWITQNSLPAQYRERIAASAPIVVGTDPGGTSKPRRGRHANAE